MFRFAALTVAAAVSATAAMADFAEYGKAGDWTIYVDNSRNLCFAERVDAVGIVTHMNVVSLEKGIASMGVFVTSDEVEVPGLTDGANRQITLAFENGNVFQGVVKEVAGLPANYEGGVIQTDNPQFMEDVRQQKVMFINPEGDMPLALSLEGTKAAMEVGVKCLTEHHGN